MAGLAFTADAFRAANLERWKAKTGIARDYRSELSVVVGGIDLVKFLPDPGLDGSLAANTGSNSQNGPSIDIETKKLERMIQKP